MFSHKLHQPISASQVGGLGYTFEPKKAGKKSSHVIFVLDDSTSMQSCRAATISGFNEYLKTQKTDAKKEGIKAFVSLYKFDGSNVTCVYNRENIRKVADLNAESYNPRGMTNLYDGIGGVMLNINEMLASKKKVDRDSVIITVLTDGQENASRTFSSNDVKQMVEKAEGKNWGFMFLGANINAFEAGSVLGFGQNNTIQYDTNNIGDTMAVASNMTTRLRSATKSGQSMNQAYASSGFTDTERSLAVGDDDG